LLVAVEVAPVALPRDRRDLAQLAQARRDRRGGEGRCGRDGGHAPPVPTPLPTDRLSLGTSLVPVDEYVARPHAHRRLRGRLDYDSPYDSSSRRTRARA